MTLEPDDIISPPTTNDIARAAGVSLATVDRVLNARPGVRAVTIERVQEAISRLGYVRDTAAANLARQRRYQLRFLLPDGQNEFVDTLRTQISVHTARLLQDRTVLRQELVPAFDPQAMAQAIRSISPDECDGLAVMGPETPSVRDAIDELRGRGVPVVALVSDLPSSARDHFVGIDNIAAGRTAGLLMSRFTGDKPTKVLVIAGSMLARDHLERRLGFDTVIQEERPDVVVLPSLEGRDDPDEIARLLPTAFEAHPDITGIYALGAGNQGLVRFLEDRDLSRRLTVIAHELTRTSRDALASGTFDVVIAQDTGHLIRSAARVLRAKSDNAAINPSQETIRIDVFLRENMPPQPPRQPKET